jgi:hypothetical protein
MTKDTIYLEENLDAFLLTIKRMKEFHEKHMRMCHCDVLTNTQQNLEYRSTVIDSLRLQVVSMQKRAQNLIQLVSS